eukprot:gene723-896_t
MGNQGVIRLPILQLTTSSFVFDTCIHTVLTELNNYLRTRAGYTETVQYSNYAELYMQELSTSEDHRNRIVMSVVGITPENMNQNPTRYVPQGNGYIIQNMPINFYLHVLFSANYQGNSAIEGLKYLSYVVAFFQSKDHFTLQNTPSLQGTSLKEFSAFLVKSDYHQKEALWSGLNTAHTPSLIYKIGTIPIADVPAVWPQVAAINKIS